MADRITSMTVFRAVAEQGGFARAARRLRLSNAAVSKHVAALEAALGVRLLQRTTRAVSLTAVGRAYLDRSARLLDELAALDAGVRAEHEEPRGPIRVSAPNSWGLIALAPALPALFARHPGLEVELSFTDRFVDLIEEGYDVALRAAIQMPDSSLIAAPICRHPRLVVAAPAYLARHGTPRHPRDLARHRCLRYARLRDRDHWTLTGARGETKVAVAGPLSVDNSLALRETLIAGAGIALTPSFVVEDLIAGGQLRTVLDGWRADPVTLSAVYPASRALTGRVRAFLAFVRERFGNDRDAVPPARLRRRIASR
jgi:DNA-binding transcriptional LysR family regulator